MKRKLISLWSPNSLLYAFNGSRKVDTPTAGPTNILYCNSAVSKAQNFKLKKRRNILLGIVVLLISLIAIVYYKYNKQALEIADVAAESVSASALLTTFSTNEIQANKKFLNKVLQVTGNVTEIKYGSDNTLQVLLDADDPMSTIACTIENGEQEVKAGQTITVKGICTGFLNDVILIRCVLVPLQK